MAPLLLAAQHDFLGARPAVHPAALLLDRPLFVSLLVGRRRGPANYPAELLWRGVPGGPRPSPPCGPKEGDNNAAGAGVARHDGLGGLETPRETTPLAHGPHFPQRHCCRVDPSWAVLQRGNDKARPTIPWLWRGATTPAGRGRCPSGRRGATRTARLSQWCDSFGAMSPVGRDPPPLRPYVQRETTTPIRV